MVSEEARHEDVVVSAEHATDVARLLALAQLDGVGAEIDGVAPQEVEPGLKAHPRAHGWLGEDHGHSLALEGQVRPVPRFEELLHLLRALQDVNEGGLVVVVDVEEVERGRGTWRGRRTASVWMEAEAW